MTREPHIWTPAHDAPRQPTTDAERRKQEEMRDYDRRTLEWLRSLPVKEDRQCR